MFNIFRTRRYFFDFSFEERYLRGTIYVGISLSEIRVEISLARADMQRPLKTKKERYHANFQSLIFGL